MPRLSKHFWYMVIITVFLAELTVIAAHGLPGFQAWQWAAFAFAVLRLGRMMAWDTILQPFRNPFVEVVQHDSGAGETTSCRGTTVCPLFEAIGDLLCCPICCATHAASLLLLTITLLPTFGMALMYIMAAVGGAEVLQAILEGFQWVGEERRWRINK